MKREKKSSKFLNAADSEREEPNIEKNIKNRDNDHRFKSTFHYLNVKRVPMSNIDNSSAFDLGKERR